jgi:pilus assembly protein CpaF
MTVGPTPVAAVASVADEALLERVRRRLAAQGVGPSVSAVTAALRDESALLGDAAVLDVAAALRTDLAGLGPLQPLVADPEVTDVLVNAPTEVWVDRGRGLERAPTRFHDESAVRGLALRLAARAGRRLDEASPWIDGRLPDGVRLHAVLPPVSRAGTLISLRLARRRAFTLDELGAAGSVSPTMATALRDLIAARAAFLVTGGTGSGKTTLLTALLSLVPADQRLVLVEDSGELAPLHPHVVRLEARPANIEGAGEVTLRDLVRQALRMRPDRLVVGEVRGAECVELLAALNTGHEGGCGTVHANAAEQLPARMEALGSMAGLGRSAVASQLVAGVDAVVHVVRRHDGRREVSQIGVLEPAAGAGAVIIPALGPAGEGEGARALVRRLDRAS